MILGIVIVIIIGMWAIWGIAKLNLTPKLSTWLRKPQNQINLWATTLAVSGIASLLFCDENSVFNNLAPEAIGIAVTVHLIDRLYHNKEIIETKQKIIDQLRSPSNAVALEAARVSLDNGWFKDSSLDNIDLRKADLQDAELIGTKLKNINFSGANLTRVKFGGAIIENSNFYKTIMLKTEFDGAELLSSDFSWTKLDDINFLGAKLTKVDFRMSNMPHLKAEQAYLTQTDFRGADISNANFGGTTIISCDFRFTVGFQSADFFQAQYDQNTRWPDNLPPNNAIFVEDTNSRL